MIRLDAKLRSCNVILITVTTGTVGFIVPTIREHYTLQMVYMDKSC